MTINSMILGSTRSILTDPGFVIEVTPVGCDPADCKSLFLPGGMEIIRYPNGTAVSSIPSADPVLIVNNAPGYQVEFSSTDHQFDHTKDCKLFGLPFSSLFSCAAFVDNKLLTGERTPFL